MGYDLFTALETADGFRYLGALAAPRSAWSVTESIMQTGLIQLDERPAQAITAAVNLNLALELYLKTLLHQSVQEPPEPVQWRKHNLPYLFDWLPNEIAKSVERAYSELLVRRPQEASDFSQSSIVFSRNPNALEENTYEIPEANPSLQSLLQDHADAFVTWRYLYEVDTENDRVYSYNFRAIICAIDVFRMHVVETARRAGHLNFSIATHPLPEEWSIPLKRPDEEN